MQQELTLSKGLLALAERSERAIIDGDIETLDTLEQQQRSLLDQQVALETERQLITAELAKRLKFDRVPTLTELLPALPASEATPLAVLRRQMLATQRRLDTVNKSNARLLENAIEFVKFSLGALTSAALKPARYGVNLARLSTPSFYIDSKA